MSITSAPIPPSAALPHRKEIRQWLLPLSTRTTAYPIALLAFDYGLLLTALAGAVLLQAWWANVPCGLAAGFVIGRLFIIGHDACHQSLTPNRRLNHWLGRVAFLPSLTPYSLWEVGHNVVHHGYTNLKGFDFVWAPCTAQEYAALSPMGRRLDRIYRSGWGPGLYYMVEIWWKRMFFPTRRQMPTRRPVFLWDNLLVSGFALLWVAALALAAHFTARELLPVLLTGFVVPFLSWCAMIGFVVYVHHTHTAVHWHDGAPDLPLRHRRRHAPHHGAHRAPRGHDDPAVPAEGRAGPAGTHAARAHRGAALLLALVLRHRAPLQAV